MTKEQYLKRLEKALRKLPAQERDDALQYYAEYFEDSNLSEEETSEALGNPNKVASSILANFNVGQLTEETSSGKKGWSAFKTIILFIFAAPIGLPIALALILIILAVFIMIVAVVLSVGLAAIAMVVAGIVTSIIALTTIMTHLPTALASIGVSLMTMGVGLLIGLGIYYLAKKIIQSMVSWVQKRAKKGETYEN